MGDGQLTTVRQVRAVALADDDVIFSASRDTTVRRWTRQPASPPSYDGSLVSHGSAFINAVAYVPPSEAYRHGLVVSGGQEAIIEVKAADKSAEQDADALLLGHSGNVCALTVSDDGRLIVSGSWDGEARVWEVGKWDSSTVLKGHEGSVWAVLVYDADTIITGTRSCGHFGVPVPHLTIHRLGRPVHPHVQP